MKTVVSGGFDCARVVIAPVVTTVVLIIVLIIPSQYYFAHSGAWFIDFCGPEE